ICVHYPLPRDQPAPHVILQRAAGARTRARTRAPVLHRVTRGDASGTNRSFVDAAGVALGRVATGREGPAEAARAGGLGPAPGRRDRASALRAPSRTCWSRNRLHSATIAPARERATSRARCSVSSNARSCVNRW